MSTWGNTTEKQRGSEQEFPVFLTCTAVPNENVSQLLSVFERPRAPKRPHQGPQHNTCLLLNLPAPTD